METPPPPTPPPGLVVPANTLKRKREPEKRTLTNHTLETKYRAIIAVEAGKKKKVDIAREFGIKQNTLSTWLKNKESYKEKYESSTFAPTAKKMRTADYGDVEKALDLWFREARAANIPISGPILLSRAHDLATQLGHDDFTASSGWLWRFKNRHGYQFRTICGEAASVSQDVVQQWKTGPLATILQSYSADDIFNPDETGLFW